MQSPPFSLTVSFPPADHPTSDLRTHTSYLAKREVDLLPLRRVLTKNKQIRESVIMLNELAPENSSLLLRIKHVALDFTRDFGGALGTVPGERFIGKLPSRHAVVEGDVKFHPRDKLLVFPYSACWLRNSTIVCDNCISTSASDVKSYHTHRRTPCTRDLVYGRSLHGGLQEYIRVSSPSHTLVKVPEPVSLHDCCFLFDVALPLLSFCVDVLVPLLESAPHGRILIFLADVRREANDCLLVLRHLGLDHSLFTFTDTRVLAERPELDDKYRYKFQHVLVFASGEQAVERAISFGVSTGSTVTKSSSTLALFHNQKSVGPCPNDRTLHRHRLSYKDKFLMEELLETLASLNKADGPAQSALSGELILRMHSVESSATSSSSDISQESESELNSFNSAISKMIAGPFDTQPSSEENLGAHSGKSGNSGNTAAPNSGRGHVSWLHCDRDFRLCSDDNCAHGISSRCHQTETINSMLAQNSDLRRVFYTHRSACHVKLNAFIF